MRALTIKQPYAAWIADGHKTIEYRSWATAYRGPLLITASASPANIVAELDDGTTRTLPAACLVCVVDLVDISGGPGNYQWHLSTPRPVEPLPVRGKLKLWDYAGPINYLPAGMDWLDYKEGGGGTVAGSDWCPVCGQEIGENASAEYGFCSPECHEQSERQGWSEVNTLTY